jgi:sulfoxide reductase catalytic subunit YedY
MKTRRQFVICVSRLLTALGLSMAPTPALVRHALSALQRRILPADIELQSLINEHPTSLDTRHLKVMPVEEFRTMGATEHTINLTVWRLAVAGKVTKPLSLTYAEILALPAVEENVLLICPGIFTIHARWKGVAIREIFKMAGPLDNVTHVTLHGPEGPYEKVEDFKMDEIESSKVFLAYAVNGQPLPQKHGYPLRVVAADRFGSDWVKFVYKIEAR